MTTWNLNQMQRHLLICNGATCMGAGAEEVTKQIRDEIRKNRLDEMIHTSRTRCNGRCKDKCVVIDYPKGTWYSVQDEETSRAIVQDTAEESSIIYSVEHGERIRRENRIKGIDKYKKGRGPLKKQFYLLGMVVD